MEFALINVTIQVLHSPCSQTTKTITRKIVDLDEFEEGMNVNMRNYLLATTAAH